MPKLEWEPDPFSPKRTILKANHHSQRFLIVEFGTLWVAFRGDHGHPTHHAAFPTREEAIKACEKLIKLDS